MLLLFCILFIRMTFLRISDKCKIISVQRSEKHLWYKYHGLFVRTYRTFQQSYLSQTNTKQTGFEACFDSKRKSRNKTNVTFYCIERYFKQLFTVIITGELMNSP